jgi:hypothetical protein
MHPRAVNSCIQCVKDNISEWQVKNREDRNHKQREYRAKKKEKKS